MGNQKQLSSLIQEHKDKSGLSYTQLAKVADIRAATIQNWARGLSKRPRTWQELVKFGSAVRLTRPEMNEVLNAAEQPTLAQLESRQVDPHLLKPWDNTQPILQLPRFGPINFYGREQEQKQIIDQLDTKERLVVIQGMGGIGKTSLAYHISQTVQDRYPDGVLWGSLGSMMPSEILDNWGQLLNIELPRQGSLSSWATRIAAVLSRKKFLIVIDDARSLADIRQLLPSYRSKCSVLVTTRNQEIASGLVTRFEAIVSLPPLAQTASFALLEGILGRDHVQNNKILYDEICQLLGNLPLALTIFAKRQRTSLFTIKESISQLREIRTRLNRLVTADEAVRIAFEQSWAELNPAEQDAFRTLAHFSSHSFSLQSFQAIAPRERQQAILQIEKLCNLFLVSAPHDHSPRYSQHPLLAAWAYEKSDHTFQEKQVRFIKYYFNFTRAHHTNWNQIRHDWQNIMNALNSAITNGLDDIVEPFIYILQSIWYRYGYFRDGHKQYKMALSRLEHNDNPQFKKFLLLHTGILTTFLADYEEAKQLLEQALEIKIPDLDHQTIQDGDAYFYLGRIDKLQLRYDSAVAHLRQAWSAYQDHAGLDKQADTLFQLADVYFYQGQLPKAESLAQDALKIYDNAHNSTGILDTLMFLATIYQEQNRLDESLKMVNEAEKWLSQVHTPTALGSYYYAAANLNRRLAHFEVAETQLKKALNYFSNCGDLASQANTLNVIGRLAVDLHKQTLNTSTLRSGIQATQDSIDLCQEIGYPLGEVAAGYTMGKLKTAKGDRASAEAIWSQSLQMAKEIDNDYFYRLIRDELNSL